MWYWRSLDGPILKLKVHKELGMWKPVWLSGQTDYAVWNKWSRMRVIHDAFSSGQTDHNGRICYTNPQKKRE